jgi:cullin 1
MLTYPPAGANLMGSDLYNSLVRYFVQHLRHLRDVRRFAHDDGITIDFSRSIQIHYKTSFS